MQSNKVIVVGVAVMAVVAIVVGLYIRFNAPLRKDLA